MDDDERNDPKFDRWILKKFRWRWAKRSEAKGDNNMENIDKIYDLLNSITVTRENEIYVNEIKD